MPTVGHRPRRRLRRSAKARTSEGAGADFRRDTSARQAQLYCLSRSGSGIVHPLRQSEEMFMRPHNPAISRRDFGKILGAAIPGAVVLAGVDPAAQARINSRINGVLVGAITYSFRSMNPADIIKAYVDIGLGEMELMSNHAEALAAAPAGGGAGGGRRSGLTPEQQAERDAAAKSLREWRMSATEATFQPVRKKIEAAGIELKLLCYNMNVRSTRDDEIEYAFMMAKALGVDAISTSTQVSMAKRLAPFAAKHKMRVGFHGHANTKDPDEVATPESFEAVMAASPYLGANLDVGHYTEAGYDPVAFLEKHHARVTNLHLKDMKKATNGGGYTPFGQGDAPLKEVLKLVQKNRWDIPVNIEFEYQGDPLTEVRKCLTFVKEALA
jgi:sugar phosphate isomerase/epimerase